MTITMPLSDAARYTQEEVQEILSLAIASQAYEGDFTHQQLLEIAEELEISPTNLEQATQAWRDQQGDTLRRQSFNHYRQARLRRHLGRFAIIMTGLITLNIVTGLTSVWVIYIALPWSIKLGLEAWNAYDTQGEAYEKAFRRWQRKHKVRQWFQGWTNRLLKA